MKEANKVFDPLEALTVPAAAKLLNMSRPTLVKHIKAGELPTILIGRSRRIRRTALEVFIEHHRANGWQPYRPEPTSTIETPVEYPDEGGEVPF